METIVARGLPVSMGKPCSNLAPLSMSHEKLRNLPPSEYPYFFMKKVLPDWLVETGGGVTCGSLTFKGAGSKPDRSKQGENLVL